MTWEAITIGIALYWLRMFGDHGRLSPLLLTPLLCDEPGVPVHSRCLAQSTAQKSVLWWAAKHRHHHLFSDTEHDVHSPRHTGFLFAHVGWIFARKHDAVDLVKVGDLTKYPGADVAS